jgi:hypothetical protein
MAITVTSAPIEAPVPTPVSECLEWCLQPADADVLDTPGAFATLFIDFPATFGSIPANGTEFTIWGHTFTVDNTVPNTSMSFEIVSSGNTSGSNFRRMLLANFFFSKTTITAVGNLSETLITWNECGEQDNFTGVNMDLAALVSAGATSTPTNGTTPIFVSGAIVQTRLLKTFLETGEAPITLYEGHTPSSECDSAGAVCVDYMQDAKRTLYTPMPDLTLSSEIDPDITTMIAYFNIQYGITFRDANCQPQSGVFESPTDSVLVMDTVFELQENLGMRRYIYDHPDNSGGQPALSPQFLTNKPARLQLGENSFAWLWLAAGYQSLLPITNIVVRFNVFYNNGTTAFVDVNYDPILANQVHCFNVSPGRLLSLFSLANLSTVSHYFVRATADGSETVGWETYFGIEHACEDMVDVYFKTPPGGIGTILCEVTDRDVVQEGTEICLNTACATTRLEAGKYSGRMLNQLRSYEKVTLKARRNFSEDEVAYFRSLKASPERWIQVEETGVTGTWMAKRLLVDTGGVKIMQVGEYIDLIIEGTLQDIPIQNPRKSG